MGLGIRLGLAACLAGAVLAPAAAQADSLVFIKDYNVWLANPDGSGQVQLTTNGTADGISRYFSPSQADDGTIVVKRYKAVLRLDRAGNVLNTVVDFNFTNKIGPFDPAVSPDGKIVAYDYVNPNSNFTSFGYSWADGTGSDGLTGAESVGDAAWISNSQVVLRSGATIRTAAPTGPFGSDHWFGYEDVDPLFDPDVAGDRLVLIKGGDQAQLRVLTLTGPAPALPTSRCQFSGPNGRFDDPTLAPDGSAMAWGEDNGIWRTSTLAGVTSEPSNCGQDTLIIPGGSEPDWGPFGVSGPAPAPGPSAPPGGAGPAPPQAPQPPPDATAPTATLAVKPPRLAAALRSGIPVTLTCSETCAAVVQLLLDAKLAKKLAIKSAATVVVGTKGAGLVAGRKQTVIVKFTSKAKRKLSRLGRLNLAVRAIVTDAASNASKSTRKITLKR